MNRRAVASVVAAWAVAIGVAGMAAHAPPSQRPVAPPVPDAAAFIVRSLDNARDAREARPEILDTPVFPGSVVKAVALVAALESGAIRADSAHMCRRVITVDGTRFVCAHPDLKRPLTPAEALAYSCNDFFVSLAPRLSRSSLNRIRVSAGLPLVFPSARLAPALVGLDGPRTTPRALIDVMARLVGVGTSPAVPMRPETRRVLIEGLRGAGDYGTAAAFKARGMSVLAKTGTVMTASGSELGMVVALAPADRPTRGLVLVAPGGAGLDAAGLAADLLAAAPQASASAKASADKPEAVSIRLGRTLPDGRTRVETIPLDDYVAQVLAGEGQPKAGDAAQEALAITARTFALANHNRHRAEGFDLCDTTHCQVVRPSTAVTRRAAQVTSGRVLLYKGEAAFVFYSAWCGGHSELASRVWPGAIDYSYEPSIDDEACRDEPGWVSEIGAADIERSLRVAGLRGSRLRDLDVASRNPSGRVDRIRVDGFTPSDVGGHEFRMAVGRVVGWQALKSTAFDVERTSTGYRFRGRGFGHGVGLCVIGAGVRAMRGASADDILSFYYPGLTIGPVPSGELTTAVSGAALRTPAPRTPALSTSAPSTSAPRTSAPGTSAPSTSAPRTSTPDTLAPGAAVPGVAAPTDIALALPASEEGERSAVLSLVRKARDEVAQATGANAPVGLRVTIHPTVESFGRATGQPWWVSGATQGVAIDLLPVSILRQQGQLERTVRHEVAHAVLDGLLAGKPMWVREGAAAYFAKEAGARGQKSAKVPCPDDLELLRPVSAGAQRDAYARAEACFARRMADGKRWGQIR